MAAMLDESKSKKHLHKYKMYFPKENHSIVLLLQHGHCEHIPYNLNESPFESKKKKNRNRHDCLQGLWCYLN